MGIKQNYDIQNYPSSLHLHDHGIKVKFYIKTEIGIVHFYQANERYCNNAKEMQKVIACRVVKLLLYELN